MATLYFTIYTNSNAFYMCVHLCVLVGSWRSMSGIFLNYSSAWYFSRIYSFFIYVYSCLYQFMCTIQIECSGSYLSLLPHLWGYKYAPLNPTLRVGAGIQSSGLHVCMATDRAISLAPVVTFYKIKYIRHGGMCDSVIESTHSTNKALDLILHIIYLHTKIPLPPKACKMNIAKLHTKNILNKC